MGLRDQVIITCAISGAVANRDQCPAIPYTPEEYAAEARRIVDEGGSMIVSNEFSNTVLNTKSPRRWEYFA